MYTYSKIRKRVRAYVIKSVKGKEAVTERGDTITLSTTKAKKGDFIIVELNVDADAKQVEQWVARDKFKDDYRRD